MSEEQGGAPINPNEPLLPHERVRMANFLAAQGIAVPDYMFLPELEGELRSPMRIKDLVERATKRDSQS